MIVSSSRLSVFKFASVTQIEDFKGTDLLSNYFVNIVRGGIFSFPNFENLKRSMLVWGGTELIQE